MVEQCHLSLDDLQQYAKAIFGNAYTISGVTSIHGGAQKVVYKLEFAGGFACMLYVWDMQNNYFREEIQNDLPIERSYGGDLFEQNNIFLTRIGVRTPTLYEINKERERYLFDFAFVEYVPGQSAEAYMAADPAVQQTVFTKINEMLVHMHTVDHNVYGKISGINDNAVPCHHLQLRDAEKQLAFLAQYANVIKDKEGLLAESLHTLESRIVRRDRYAFIHGELGPDHVLIGDKLEPYLIDIEGAMFYDLEYEHSFLAFRFGRLYDSYLRSESLDCHRMNFYRLYHHISCATGGLKLMQRGFPNQALAESIYTFNLKSALALVGA